MMFKTQFDLPPRPPSPVGGVSMTDASELPNCDINTIVRRYNAGDDSVVRTSGIFADVSEITDFAASMDRVLQARRDFEALPSQVRDRFGNDAVALVNWLSDRNNDSEAVRLGLRVRSAEDKVVDSVASVTDKASSAQPDDGRVTNT